MRKIVMVICIVCMALAMGTAGFAISLEHESNNTMQEATPIPTSTEGEYIFGVITEHDTEDWFCFNTDSREKGSFYLMYSKEGFNADFYLYDENGQVVAKAKAGSWSEDGSIDFKGISHIKLDSYSNYYLKVEYKSGSLNEPYQIKARTY